VKDDGKMYDKACEEFKKAELLSKPSASLLVKKGICIQLSSEECPYSLEDAEKAFKDAIDEEKDYIEAYIELAHYYSNVQRDTKTAKFYFEQALEIARKFTCELIAEIALCISENESPEVA
jgi:tetratricopeptide (TPR) repeat protein